MTFNYNKLKFILAILVLFAIGAICSSSKDDKKEETKKEETTKEETTKEETTKEETTSDETGVEGARLYFCEEYSNGKEIGVSDAFTISSGGGYFTCMIDLRPTGKKIGVGKLDLRITKLTSSGEKIIDTKNFDVQPDWDYIYFDKFYTFHSDGKYKITALKPDGTPVASGTVKISYR
jgi:hypothetical protein